MLRKMLLAACAMASQVVSTYDNGLKPIWPNDKRVEFPIKTTSIAIYVQLEIGYSKVPFMTQIDTGSCNLVVPHKVCVGCISPQKFSSLNERGSRQETRKTRIKNYLGTRLETVLILSFVNLNQIVGLWFEVAVSQKGNQKWSGILGLCPQRKQKHFHPKLMNRDFFESHKYNYRQTLPLALKAQNGLKGFQNIFSIYLSEKDGESMFTIGALPSVVEDWMVQYYQIEILSMGADDYESNYWSVPFTQAKIGSQTLASEAHEVILDTGCTLHQARKSLIDQILHHQDLRNCKRYNKGQGSLICDCSQETFESLPSLEIVVGEEGSIFLDKDRWAQYNSKYGKCAIMFQELPQSWTEDLIIFGLQFFKQYFTVFDNERQRVGLKDYKEIEA